MTLAQPPLLRRWLLVLTLLCPPVWAAAKDLYATVRDAPAGLLEQTAPSWRIPIGRREVEVLRWLDDRHLALATVQPRLLSLRQLPVEIWRVGDGEPLVEIDRPGKTVSTAFYRFAGVQLVHTVQGIDDSGQRLSAVDLAAAKVRWQRRLDGLSRVFPLPELDLLLEVEPRGRRRREEVRVRAVAAHSGNVRWQEELRLASSLALEVQPTADGLVLAATDLRLLDPRTGELIWSRPLPGDGSPVLSSWRGRLALRSGDALHVLAADTGDALWSHQPDGPLLASYAHPAGPLLLATGAAAGDAQTATQTLTALDWEGRVRWRLELPAATTSTLVLDGERLAYSMAEALVLRRLNSGAELRRETLPEALQPGKAAWFMRVAFDGDAVLAANAAGWLRLPFDATAAAVTGALSHPASGGIGAAEGLRGDATAHRLAARQSARQLTLADLAATLSRRGADGDGDALAGLDTLAQAFDVPDLRPANPTQVLIPLEIAYARMNASFARNQALRELGTSLVAASEAFFQGIDDTIELGRQISRFQYRQRGEAFAADPLLTVAPPSGCTVEVADPRDGRVARVPWRPMACRAFRCSAAGTSAGFVSATVSPDGRRLAVDGLGTDPSFFEPPHGVLGGERYPSFSVLVYEVDDFAFEAATPLADFNRYSADKECMGMRPRPVVEAAEDTLDLPVLTAALERGEISPKLRAALERAQTESLLSWVWEEQAGTPEYQRREALRQLWTGPKGLAFLETAVAKLLPSDDPSLCGPAAVFAGTQLTWQRFAELTGWRGRLRPGADRTAAGGQASVDDEGWRVGGTGYAGMLAFLEAQGWQHCTGGLRGRYDASVYDKGRERHDMFEWSRESQR